MIQANELRIGNWIDNHREPEQVGIWHLQVADKNEYFTPIPLTEDALKDCGFEYKGAEGYQLKNGSTLIFYFSLYFYYYMIIQKVIYSYLRLSLLE